jgi:hypothetical protein
VRDVGILIWVVLVIVGVVGSMISSVRKQAQAQGPGPAAPPGRRAKPPTVLRQVARAAPVPAPPSPQPAVKRAPGPPRETPAAHAPDEPQVRRHRFFTSKRDIVHGIVAAEVFGKPRGLHDEHLLY